MYSQCDIDAGRAPSLHDFPVETLIDIFFLAREPRLIPPDNLDSNLEWIPATTHVCSRWRSIALATPFLWTTIVTTGLDAERSWLPIMLERAAGNPLDVFVSIELWGGPSQPQIVRETLELLLPHSSTFRTVLFRFNHYPDISLRALISHILVQMTDVLDLCLIHPTAHATSAPPAYDGMTLNRSGRLRRLILHGVHFQPWKSPAYASLRVLELVRSREEPTNNDFLDILRACPRLEEFKVECLEIHRATTSPSESLSDTLDVALPHLRLFHLRGRPEHAPLVDRITVSRACKDISVSYYISPEHAPAVTDNAYSYVIPAATLYEPFLAQVESLVFDTPSTAGADAIYTAHGPSGSGYELRGRVELDWDRMEWEILPPLTPAAWEAWLRPFARLSASTLVRLQVLGYFFSLFTEDMWAAALAGFPCLRSLDVDTRDRRSAMKKADVLCVAAALQRVSSSGEGAACAPHLRQLTFAYVVVDEGIVEPFVRMLKWRAARGAVPLSKLVLEPKWSDELEGQIMVHSQLQKRVRELGVTVSTSIDQP